MTSSRKSFEVISQVHQTRRVVGVGILVAVFATSGAQAEIHTFSIQEKSAAPSLFDKLLVSYENVLLGPPIEAPLSMNQSNKWGETDADDSDHIAMEHSLALGYKFSKTSDIAIVPSFKWEPVDQHTTTLYDPYVRLNDENFFSSGGYGLAAQLRVYIPASDESLANNLVTVIRIQQTSTYAISDSRFTLGVLTYLQTYVNSSFHSDEGAPNTALFVYGGPTVEYQLTPTVSLTALYELTASSLYDDVMNFSNTGTAFQPGMSWNITPTFNFSPYVHITSGYRVAADTTTIGWTIAWKIM